MRQYFFIRSRDKRHATRFFVYHCTILDSETNLCYHFSGRSGYVCESLEDFKKENSIIKITPFWSDKNIEQYYNACKLRKHSYNTLTNNCETFANGFVGNRNLSRQTEFYLFSTMLVALIKYK